MRVTLMTPTWSSRRNRDAVKTRRFRFLCMHKINRHPRRAVRNVKKHLRQYHFRFIGSALRKRSRCLEGWRQDPVYNAIYLELFSTCKSYTQHKYIFNFIISVFNKLSAMDMGVYFNILLYCGKHRLFVNENDSSDLQFT